MDKPANTNFTLSANQTYPLASETNWSATREWPVCSSLSREDKDEKCHYNILAFDCGHSIPHPYLPYISHVSTCQYLMTTPKLSCSNMGTSAFITKFRDCDKCTKSKLAREGVALNQTMEMKELSSKLKEKSLPELHMEGASKKSLETKRTLPSRSFGPKVLGCGQLAPAVNNSSKPKIMSANMKEKLSEHKLEDVAGYSAKQKKNVTFDLDRPRFCGGFADALQKEIQEDMQARSSLHELHQKFNDFHIEGSSSKLDNSPRSYASISSEKHFDQFREEGSAGSKRVAQFTPKEIEGYMNLSPFEVTMKYLEEKNKEEDFELINKNEQLGLGKHKDAVWKLLMQIAAVRCQTGRGAASAMGNGYNGNGNGNGGEVEDADWEFVEAE